MGEEGGSHFYAVELIDGPSLDAVIRQLRDDPDGDTPTGLPASAATTGPYVLADPSPPPSGSNSGPRSSSDRFDRFHYGVLSYVSSPAELEATLAFLEGTASEAELLSRPASRGVECCLRPCLIGWRRLGTGDRAGAEKAFGQAYEGMPFNVVAGMVARAVLIRMKDPDWPRAIPAKK